MITTFKWFCIDKGRCDSLDEELKEVTDYAAHLSSYVVNGYVNGLECLKLDARFKAVIKDIRAERASLWRRVKVELKDEVEDMPEVLHMPVKLYHELIEKQMEVV
jgi:hypothetical protein